MAGQAAAGSGVGPAAVGFVLGIAKAYTTRVGAGPFPTELNDDIGARLGERGHEFGTVTGRPRRCGWFDAVLVRQAVKVGGIEGIALTKLDVLDGLPDLKICVGYRIGDTRARPPAGRRSSAQAAAEPDLRDDARAGPAPPAARAPGRDLPAAGGQVCPPHRGTGRRRR